MNNTVVSKLEFINMIDIFLLWLRDSSFSKQAERLIKISIESFLVSALSFPKVRTYMHLKQYLANITDNSLKAVDEPSFFHSNNMRSTLELKIFAQKLKNAS